MKRVRKNIKTKLLFQVTDTKLMESHTSSIHPRLFLSVHARSCSTLCDPMDVSLSELRELVMYREAWHADIHGVAESDTTEQYTEELYKKDFHDPDNHDGVIIHLEPDILECEVKCTLGGITVKNLVEVMEFQLSYVKS